MDIKLLCEEFCDYSSSIRGYSNDTIRRYRYVINCFSKFARVDRISDVTEENVRALFYYGRAERNWSVNTFIVYHKTLLVFCRWCVKQGYMQSNPVVDIEKPRLEKALPKKLSLQDAHRLIEVVLNYPYGYTFLRHRNHAIFAMFIFAGLRKQELLNLKVNDIDVENLTIFIRRGKGNKDRVVPMSFSLAQILKRYAQERKRLKKTNPHYFTSLRGNIPYTVHGLKRLVDLARQCSGIDFSVHKLRHTFATLMLEGGCDIFSLSQMMGHSDIKTTTIYLSASALHLRKQITKHPMNTMLTIQE